MYESLDLIIRFGIVFLFGYGLWILIGGAISNLFHEMIRKESVLRKARQKKKQDCKLIKYLTQVLSVVIKKEAPHHAYLFLLGSIILFAFSFVLLLRLESIQKSFVLSVLISLIPFIILQARLRSIRIDGSYEGNSMVTAIINNYKQFDYNMIAAIDKTACSDQLSFFTRNNLLRLSLALKAYRAEDELDDSIKTFVFAYGTEWAILLGMNIKISAFDGTNVTLSLEDILEELKAVSESMEANKRFNNEGFTMIRFLLIPLYFFTVYISIAGFGFTLKKFFQYQFFTSIGLNFGLITFSSIILCFVVYSFVKRPKFDM